jgi:ATP dependent DNA ligase domain
MATPCGCSPDASMTGAPDIERSPSPRLLRARSFTLDGEAVVCGPDGVAVFDALHRRGTVSEAMLYAFDVLELDGEDLRALPLSDRKKRPARLLRGRRLGIVLSDHTDDDGATIFRQACSMGLEGIVSKRLNAPYRSGRSRDWLKIKNPDSPAMIRARETEGRGRAVQVRNRADGPREHAGEWRPFTRRPVPSQRDLERRQYAGRSGGDVIWTKDGLYETQKDRRRQKAELEGAEPMTEGSEGAPHMASAPILVLARAIAMARRPDARRLG